MVFNFEFFRILRDNLHQINLINKELLLRIFLDYLLKVNFLKVDHEKINFVERDSGYEINLYSIGENCNIHFEISDNNIITIQLNYGGEYVNAQPINDWNDLHKYRLSLDDLFHAHIEEVIVSYKQKIKKVSYLVHHMIDQELLSTNYTTIFGHTWFWQKPNKKKITYFPWITDDN